MLLYGADNNNTVNMTDRSERDRETVGVVILNTKTHAAKKKEMKQKNCINYCCVLCKVCKGYHIPILCIATMSERKKLESLRV